MTGGATPRKKGKLMIPVYGNFDHNTQNQVIFRSSYKTSKLLFNKDEETPFDLCAQFLKTTEIWKYCSKNKS